MQPNLFNLRNIRYWYLKFRDSNIYTLTLVSVTIVVCTILLFGLIVPQFENWFSIRNAVLATRQDIYNINQSVSLIQGINKDTLSQQFDTVSSALPNQKNFGDISNAITYAALVSGVSLQDYTFQVGRINIINSASFQQTSINLEVTGGIDKVRTFVSAIYSVLPLAQVTSITGTQQTATIGIVFFSSGYSSFSFSPHQPILPLSSSQETLLDQISAWQSHSTSLPQPVSSGSANSLF